MTYYVSVSEMVVRIWFVSVTKNALRLFFLEGINVQENGRAEINVQKSKRSQQH